jgi:tetratricopeptide (TPR) repeat protein
LEAVSVLPMQEADAREPKAWIVQARPCSKQVSPFVEARKARRLQASEANARGEGLYGEGDLVGALAAFAEAAKLWSEDAVYLNNLATVLDALGYTDEAWRRFAKPFTGLVYLPSSAPNGHRVEERSRRRGRRVLTMFAAWRSVGD